MGESVGARYTAVAIVLHWAIAAAILGNLLLGGWMHQAIDDAATQARAITGYQLHKSLGLTVLVLTVLRLAWRLSHRPPPLPPAMRAWERFVARATHWAFYGLMVVLPLSGWLYVSTQWRNDAALNVPTLWFGLFEVPHLFGLSELAPELRRARAAQTFGAHFYLAWSMAALLVLHMAAALKHHFVDRDTVLASMIPGVPTAEPVAGAPEGGRRAILVAGFAAIGLAAAAIGLRLLIEPAATLGGPAEIRSAPGGWIVAPASEIAFAGEHAGAAFRGRFTRWHADIRFDPAAPGTARIAATVETGSATDGVRLHDETLPQAEWFDVANHPQAAFRATRIAPRAGGSYDVEGTLTIKNRELKLPPLVLRESGGAIEISGRVEIDRADADLGMESDPAGEYVSRKIVVEVRVRATPR